MARHLRMGPEDSFTNQMNKPALDCVHPYHYRSEVSFEEALFLVDVRCKTMIQFADVVEWKDPQRIST